MEIPGCHGACHLDDAVCPDRKTQHQLWGGWHDAGDYNKCHNAPYVYGLLRAYGNRRAAWMHLCGRTSQAVNLARNRTA